MTPLEHITGLIDPSYSEPIRRAVAQGILDKHAHELAEKQRAWLIREGYDTSCVCGSCSACLASDYINLIDPEGHRDPEE